MRTSFDSSPKERRKHYEYKHYRYKNCNLRRRTPCGSRVARLYRSRLHGYAPQCAPQRHASIVRRLGDLFRPESHAGGGAHLLHCVWSAVWRARSGGVRVRRTELHLYDHSGSAGSGNNGPSGSLDLGSCFPVSRMGSETSHSHASSPLSKRKVGIMKTNHKKTLTFGELIESVYSA